MIDFGFSLSQGYYSHGPLSLNGRGDSEAGDRLPSVGCAYSFAKADIVRHYVKPIVSDVNVEEGLLCELRHIERKISWPRP